MKRRSHKSAVRKAGNVAKHTGLVLAVGIVPYALWTGAKAAYEFLTTADEDDEDEDEEYVPAPKQRRNDRGDQPQHPRARYAEPPKAQQEQPEEAPIKQQPLKPASKPVPKEPVAAAE